jgi:hypothetical protein
MLDEAFAVFSRIDAGGTVANQHTAPTAKNHRRDLPSAARDLVTRISAQLESIDRQRHELERLLSDAEASAS